MKNSYKLFIILLVVAGLASCNKDELEPSNQFNWTKVIVQDASTIYSLSGNIHSELTIGGLGELRKTKDAGKTWQVVLDNITAYELRSSGDTIFAIDIRKDYFSTDNGNTWHLYWKKFLDDNRSMEVTASNGVMYKVESSVKMGHIHQPDKVFKSVDNGNTWTDIFPHKHYIYSIYLDESDRLYLGISSVVWDEEKESFDSFKSDNNAIIYYLSEAPL